MLESRESIAQVGSLFEGMRDDLVRTIKTMGVTIAKGAVGFEVLLEAVRTLEHGVDPIGFLAGTALIGNTALIKYLVEQNKKNKPHE